MGTITHLHERLRPVPNRIDAEGEVLVVASALLSAMERWPVAEALGRSGLLAVSVPSDFGGLDVSNVVLAEAVALIATVSARAAETLASHCAALEAIRNAGSEGQRGSAFAKSSGGERFLLATSGGIAGWRAEARFLPDGMGVRVDGRVELAAAIDAEWFAVPAADSSGQLALLLVPHNAPGLDFSEAGDAGGSQLRLAGVHVAADSVLALTGQAAPMVEGVYRLLRAAVILGQSRRGLEEVVASIGSAMDATAASDHAIGWRQVEIETVYAQILRAAAAIDVAQVNPAGATIAEAHRLSTILGLVAHRMNTGRTATGEEDAVIVALGRQMLAGRGERAI